VRLCHAAERSWLGSRRNGSTRLAEGSVCSRRRGAAIHRNHDRFAVHHLPHVQLDNISIGDEVIRTYLLAVECTATP
jgi:hypothetical protein